MKTLVIVTLACFGLALAKLPKTWKNCKGEKDVNACLAGAIEGAVKSLKGGNQHLGVLSIDPLHFEAVQIHQGEGPVTINLNFKNLDLIGLSKPHVDNVTFDPAKGLIKFRLNTTNALEAKGDYTTNGKVLILPIVGEGKSWLTFENFSGVMTVKGKIVETKKAKHFHVDDFGMDIYTSKLKMNFEGLFHGDKKMGDHMNKFLNDNWEIILSELRPAISMAFGRGFKEISNRIFGKIPFNEIAN